MNNPSFNVQYFNEFVKDNASFLPYVVELKEQIARLEKLAIANDRPTPKPRANSFMERMKPFADIIVTSRKRGCSQQEIADWICDNYPNTTSNNKLVTVVDVSKWERENNKSCDKCGHVGRR